MTREQAYKLVTDWTKNVNLVKHMLAVEAQMRAIAKHFGEDEDLWGLAGLLHDADYEQFKDTPKLHPSKIFTELENVGAHPDVINAIKAHAWGWQEEAPEPKNKFEWALFTTDELSGLIIAVALTRPDRKLSSVTVESILKKFPEKKFAAGVHREHIELCEEKLGIKLEDYIAICLKAQQGIADELGL